MLLIVPWISSSAQHNGPFSQNCVTPYQCWYRDGLHSIHYQQRMSEWGLTFAIWLATDAEWGSGRRGRKTACKGGGRGGGSIAACEAAVTGESNFSEWREGREREKEAEPDFPFKYSQCFKKDLSSANSPCTLPLSISGETTQCPPPCTVWSSPCGSCLLKNSHLWRSGSWQSVCDIYFWWVQLFFFFFKQGKTVVFLSLDAVTELRWCLCDSYYDRWF